MKLASQSGEVDQRLISPKISAALIDSLFENQSTVHTGIVFMVFSSALTALRTDQIAIWVCCALLLVAGIIRIVDFKRYMARQATLSAEESERWKTRYQVGATIQAAAIGAWGFTTLLTTDDAIAHMICVTVLTGIVSGAACRAYGRPSIFHRQALLMYGPSVVALALCGTPYYVAMSVITGGFLIIVMKLSTNLHGIFLRALVARQREAAIAGQFDTALNNMPHGLCMFGADGRLAVMNERFTEMMRLGADFASVGASATEVAAACVHAGTLSSADADGIVAPVDKAKAANFTTLQTNDGQERALEWTFQPMADGGSVVLVEDITERRRAEARISHLARFDELTGLPNRVSFQQVIDRELSHAEAAHRLSALLFIDLDQFKQVNDTLGHPAGDRLLCAVASRLREIIRPDDYVARFGGDEFVVFQHNIRSNEDAAALARRIVDRLSERYDIDHHTVEIGASIGIAMTSLHLSSDHLLRNADMALYRAKADGRGTFCFFREELAQVIEARRSLELDLRQAMANEEFELYFQPLVNLKSGRVSTCETLLRWHHPTRGPVSPAEIIPVVEDMGMIVDLGRWILRRACMECMTWPEAVTVAVNFSSQQFHRRDVLSDVRYALEVSGLPAHRLEIEITESSLLRNTQWTRDVLSQLRAEGVSISLDDFGTGYSSLSYLHTFPLQKVKIDRSFLEGIETDRPQTLLRGIARLSTDLGMSVVVEGIETNEQLELISKDGTVSEAQGYLFSKPVPATQIRQLLRASHARKLIPTLETAAPVRSIA